LQKRYGDEIELIQFGSTARKDFDDESDIDILVLIPANVDNALEEEIFREAFNVELEYDVIFGIIVYSRDFWKSDLAGQMPLYQEIKKDGTIV